MNKTCFLTSVGIVNVNKEIDFKNARLNFITLLDLHKFDSIDHFDCLLRRWTKSSNQYKRDKNPSDKNPSDKKPSD